EQIKQLVREKLDKGAVVSANSVAKPSEEDEEEDDLEPEE
ncbi:MAG: recombinase RecA, partial [Nostoc sp.]